MNYKNYTMVFNSGRDTGTDFNVKIGDIIDGTENCNNDMEGYIVKVIGVEEQSVSGYKCEIIEHNSNRLSHRIGDIWNMRQMRKMIHPGCKVYRKLNIDNWQEELED